MISGVSSNVFWIDVSCPAACRCRRFIQEIRFNHRGGQQQARPQLRHPRRVLLKNRSSTVEENNLSLTRALRWGCESRDNNNRGIKLRWLEPTPVSDNTSTRKGCQHSAQRFSHVHFKIHARPIKLKHPRLPDETAQEKHLAEHENAENEREPFELISLSNSKKHGERGQQMTR